MKGSCRQKHVNEYVRINNKTAFQTVKYNLLLK